ncbi:MAG: 2Fe-2S iron-sulfur cluster-binding protein [Syntrophobacteraceae bacterium]|jgi:succinate dehydrogenase / fumarate reductase iron-sulfur subunit
MDVALKICRYDPEKDTSAYFQELGVSLEENGTVLDALLLAWQQDPTLSFRRSCRSAICGSCAILINGRPALACQTLIRKAEANGGPLTLEPLSHFRQLKDLVVDLEPLFESLKAAVPWLLLSDRYDGRMDPEAVGKIENPAACILCGICQADLGEAEIKPVGVLKALRFALDPRDSLGTHRLRLLQLPPEVLGLFIKQLPRNCPKGIDIVSAATQS